VAEPSPGVKGDNSIHLFGDDWRNWKTPQTDRGRYATGQGHSRPRVLGELGQTDLNISVTSNRPHVTGIAGGRYGVVQAASARTDNYTSVGRQRRVDVVVRRLPA